MKETLFNDYPVFKNHFNYRPSPAPKAMGKLITVPDMSLTVLQIIERFKKGIPFDGMGSVTVNDFAEQISYATDGLNPRSMDIVERHELAEQKRNLFNSDLASFEAARKASLAKAIEKPEPDKVEPAA